MKRKPLVIGGFLAALVLAAVVSMPRREDTDCPCGATIFGCWPVCPDKPRPTPTPRPAPTPRPSVQPTECGYWQLWTC